MEAGITVWKYDPELCTEKTEISQVARNGTRVALFIRPSPNCQPLKIWIFSSRIDNLFAARDRVYLLWNFIENETYQIVRTFCEYFDKLTRDLDLWKLRRNCIDQFIVHFVN